MKTLALTITALLIVSAVFAGSFNKSIFSYGQIELFSDALYFTGTARTLASVYGENGGSASAFCGCAQVTTEFGPQTVQCTQYIVDDIEVILSATGGFGGYAEATVIVNW